MYLKEFSNSVSYLLLATLGRKVGRKRNRFGVVKRLARGKNGVKYAYENALTLTPSQMETQKAGLAIYLNFNV